MSRTITIDDLAGCLRDFISTSYPTPPIFDQDEAVAMLDYITAHEQFVRDVEGAASTHSQSKTGEPTWWYDADAIDAALKKVQEHTNE